MSEAPVVDARGTRCPLPVIQVARAAKDLPHGATVVLLADDEAARYDVPAWARMRGHEVSLEREGSWTRYTVRLGGSAAGATEARST